jgi:hypothetical protein
VTHVFLIQKWMNNTMFLSQFQHLWRLPWPWNNQNKYIPKGHEPTMTKTCLDLNPNHGTRIPRIRTWSVQNVSLNITLLWKHGKIKTWLWCKIVPKIGVEYIKGNMKNLPPCIPFSDLIQQKNLKILQGIFLGKILTTLWMYNR